MSRLVLSLAAALAVVATAVADLGPPPGQKYVTVTTAVKFEKEVPGYRFYTVGVGPGGGEWVEVKLDPKGTTTLTGATRYGGQLFAVPEAVAKEYKTAKELAAAVGAKKPAGVSSTGFGGRSVLKTTDKRDAITRTIVITAGDEKTGPTFAEEKQPDKKDPDEPTADAPIGNRLVFAGLAAALALVAGGLWAVRRK